MDVRPDSLCTLCCRALAAGARSAGTRQQVRAAARAFVRRHRRDGTYLRWVLRSVSASSTLAVALLGLSAPAAAEMPPLIARSTNLDTQDVGGRSTPALGDLDGDGDLDVLSGGNTGTFFYFQNTGSAEAAAFATAVDPGPNIGAARSSAALGDLDGDGDLDLVAGTGPGTFAYFENTGSATSALFAARTGAANPLNTYDIGANSMAALGDLDGDGDLDLVAGDEGGGIQFDYFENTGSATAPAFARRTGAENPLSGFGNGYAWPALGDLDGDGDLDLVNGNQTGGFALFENTGSVEQPAFIARTGTANPLNGQDAGTFSTPAFGDLDGDGDLDLVSGDYDGLFLTLVHLGGEFVPRFSEPFSGPLPDLDFNSAPSSGDLDADGDFDFVTGEDGGLFFYLENTGSASAPALVLRTGAQNPLNGRFVGQNSAPSLGDLDGDGDLDVMVGNEAGALAYVVNTGSAAAPAFGSVTSLAMPPLATGRSRPALGDLDGDGDADFLAGTNVGTLRYFEHTGSAIATAFVERTGVANPFDGVDLGTSSAPSLVDLDGDGDLDLVAGSAGTLPFVFENTGRATNPAFLARTGAASPFGVVTMVPNQVLAFSDLDDDGDRDALVGDASGSFFYHESFAARAPLPALEVIGGANPFSGHDLGALSAPALADIDADGDLDAVAGEDLGTLRYFENTGAIRTPAFAARTGVANPLDGRDVGNGAQPALGDLDADGDFDLLVGRSAGDFDYFANTGDAETPAFAASTANPFGLAGPGGSSAAPAFGDLDRDGDLDLVVGRYYDELAFFENTGTPIAPAFAARLGVANPFELLDVAYFARPALADFDRDGDLDLLAGTEGGRFRYFENVGSATAPSFARLFDVSNPLDGEDVGDRAAPAAGDLDGDGDADLVTGSLAGTFAVHYFPEPARGLLLAAGIALLSLFERLRSRKRR